MRKTIIIGCVIALLFAVSLLSSCSNKSSNTEAGVEEKTATEATLVTGAESLQGKKVYVVRTSIGIAASEGIIRSLEKVENDETAPFLDVVHNGKEVTDEVSGITFVYIDYEPHDEFTIYHIDGMTVEELQDLDLDTYTKKVGEFESTYGKCYVLKK